MADEAYEVMLRVQGDPEGGGPVKLMEKSYADWASLLLRYNAAIEQIDGAEGGGEPLPSMKAPAL